MTKLKVLNIVMAKLWGGGEQYVYDICQEMRSRDIEVYVAVDKSNIEFQNKFSKVAIVVCLELYRSAGLLSLLELKRFIEKNSINIVNCHSGRGMLLSMLLKTCTRVKLIAFKHNVISSKNDFYHKWQRDKVDAFICVSNLVYKMQTKNISKSQIKKYHLIYNGININNFNERVQGISNEDYFILGYAGRITRNKGIDVLIDAFLLLNKKYSKMRLLLAGNGEYLTEIKDIVSVKKIDQYVQCLGHIDYMEAFYKSLNVFILPSVVMEAFGLVICEAMYCGAVVVSTDSGAQSEIIENNVDGYIVRSNDANDLARCIENIYLNYNIQENIRRKAKEKVLDKFTVKTTVDNILDVYYALF